MTKRGVILEYIVGGGLLHLDSESIGSSFRTEGWTMLSTLVEDWNRCTTDGETWEVVAPLDPRATEWFSLPADDRFSLLDPRQSFLEQWCRYAVDADAIILIAPESGGELGRLSAAIDEVSDARLGCRSPFLERASDKWMMAEYISDEYLHPQTLTPDRFHAYTKSVPSALTREWVLKPTDGAGCDGIWKGNGAALVSYVQQHAGCPGSLIQHYLPGKPASVAAWITASGRWWLPPVWQDIHWTKTTSSEGDSLEHPTYLGGSGPIDPTYWATIHAFANRVLDLLGPGALGWVGIDFVLNEDHAQPRCSAIEVNPRWTTSYAGLRQLYDGNLLEQFLATALKPAKKLSPENLSAWSHQTVKWSASGTS